MARNYAQEYANYHYRPEHIKRRSSRNKARRLAIKAGKAKVGDGKDIHHKAGNPLKNKNGKLLNTKSGIYFDQLNEVLESMWEKQELLKKYDPQIPTIKFTNVVPKLNNGDA